MLGHPLVLLVFCAATVAATAFFWMALSAVAYCLRSRTRLLRLYVGFVALSGLHAAGLAAAFFPMPDAAKLHVYRLMWVSGLLASTFWMGSILQFVGARSRLLTALQVAFAALALVPLADGVVALATGGSFFYVHAPRPDPSPLVLAAGNVQQHAWVADGVALLTITLLMAAIVGLLRTLRRQERPDRTLMVGISVTAAVAIVEVALTPTRFATPLLFAANLIEAARMHRVYSARVGQRLRDLKRVQAEQEALLEHELGQAALSRRMARLGENTAAITHELRNPLAAITAGLDLVSKRLEAEQPPDPTLLELVEVVRQGAVHMHRLLRRVTQQSQARGPLPKAPVSLHAVATSSLGLCADAAMVEVRTDLEEEVWVRGREVELVQVCVNLLANAAQAAQRHPAPWVQLTVRAEGDKALLIVQDSGPWPPERVLSRMFRRRFTTRQEGTGLGLAICRSIIQWHGGSIGLDRWQPTTTIAVRLPRLRADEAAVGSPVEAVGSPVEALGSPAEAPVGRKEFPRGDRAIQASPMPLED